MLSIEVIKQIAPKARADYVSALVDGTDIMLGAKINTPLRMAAFLATICHETGGLTIVRENMNYSASRIRAVWPSRTEAVTFAGKPTALANSVYGFRMGNEENGTNDDDGWRYRGGGLIQLTGRNSYRAAGLSIGVNLESQPELIEDATISLRAACWEFSKFLVYCDKGEKGFRSVCNGINRGQPLSVLDPIGWADRQIWYRRCCDALGVSSVADDDVLNIGDQGAIVKAFQERLIALNYAVGRADGIFGSRTRSAVLAFQAENGLTTDGDIGPQTRAALNSETAIAMPVSVERATETTAGLRETGSVTIAATDKLKTAAVVASAVSGISGAAKESGALEQAQGFLQNATLFRTIATGLADVASWAFNHWYVVVLVGSFFVWRWARDIEVRKVLGHRLGIDLSS